MRFAPDDPESLLDHDCPTRELLILRDSSTRQLAKGNLFFSGLALSPFKLEPFAIGSHQSVRHPFHAKAA
ncbi:hypothetical protein NP233_g4884 [Leucocoprinus birnbaumii]|uniref:Uncharacterized protein n=1 Tax=Leucocoprinus birnbaumii TaxID=56174 RepID=A0AAD5VV98_9AGAR|nr:hypothetical protein NP233_g4884 [Leucocoprinus birnbaumii]